MNFVLSDPNVVPQQLNGVDCGLLVMTCADQLPDDLPLAYDQDSMPENRIKYAAKNTSITSELLIVH